MSRVSYKFIINAIIITAPLLVLTGIILFPAIYNASLFFIGIEAFIVSLIAMAVKRRRIGYFFWLMYCLLLGCQVASLSSTGNFIIPLTLSNLGEYRAVGNEALAKMVGVVFSFIIFSLFFLRVKPVLKTNKIIALLVLLIFIPGAIYHSVTTSYFFYKQSFYRPSYDYPEIAKKYLKFDIYHPGAQVDSYIKTRPKSVIVIFTEGFSSKVIDRENNKGLKLTPNIDSYYKEGLVFKNYYNHTAATFRGLRGQLTSAYQYKDGIDGKGEGFFQISSGKVNDTYKHRLISLPEILNDYGYNTYFLASTEKESNLNALLKTMPFKKVYGMEDFSWHKNDRMSDKKTFESLKELLSEQDREKPFFIGVYPSGTHHGMDSPDLIYNEGKNAFYNKFHNYDAQLGGFVRFFKDSPYYKNTILIITADHSTFPVPEFKSSFDIHANFFVDTIPLIILGNDIKSNIVDAKGYNSLSLAPTILNVLGINNHSNYFLGCSLFDKQCVSEFSHQSAIGDDFYQIKKMDNDKYDTFPDEKNKKIIEYYNVSG